MDIDKVTDAQAAEIMLMLPWQFGDVNDDGDACYSDDEVQAVIGYVRKLNARAEAAEAEVKRLQAAEVHLLAVRETLAATIDERNDALAEVEWLRVVLKLIGVTLQGAVAEIEEVHRYLDECFVNDRDEGPVVPLIDRVVVLVSQIARDNAEIERLRVPQDALAQLVAVGGARGWHTAPALFCKAGRW